VSIFSAAGGLYGGGRHTGNSLMYDAEVRQDIVIRQVGHASREISQRYNHPPRQAHLAAAGQVASLVRIPDFRLERPPCQA
jgi:integrase